MSADLATGFGPVEALDASALSISVALWLHTSEYEDWRFVLASRQLDSIERSAAHGLVREAFAAAGIPLERTPALLILKMSDPFIRALRRMFGKTKSVEGMRLGWAVARRPLHRGRPCVSYSLVPQSLAGGDVNPALQLPSRPAARARILSVHRQTRARLAPDAGVPFVVQLQ